MLRFLRRAEPPRLVLGRGHPLANTQLMEDLQRLRLQATRLPETPGIPVFHAPRIVYSGFKLARTPSRVTSMSAFLDKLPLLPTSVIGSLPRPVWLLEVLQDYLAGRLSRGQWDHACDQAVPFAVALQETAGIDILTDGEWRREGYFQVFYERVAGFAPDLIPGRPRKWPAAVAPLRRHGPIVAGGVAF